MPQETRKEQKVRTKELLLQTAYQEYSFKGILSTKTLDIAKAAGVAHGTVFMHFPTREDLLMQVVTEFGMKIGKSFQEMLHENEKGNIRHVLTIHLKVLEEYEPFYSQLIMESASLPKEVRNHLILIQAGIAHYLDREMQKGIAANAIRALPLPFILNIWMGLIHYYLMNRDLFAPGQSVIASKGDELLNGFMNLITNPRSKLDDKSASEPDRN
jgi:AcrR family transcriptional regulator